MECMTKHDHTTMSFAIYAMLIVRHWIEVLMRKLIQKKASTSVQARGRKELRFKLLTRAQAFTLGLLLGGGTVALSVCLSFIIEYCINGR